MTKTTTPAVIGKKKQDATQVAKKKPGISVGGAGAAQGKSKYSRALAATGIEPIGPSTKRREKFVMLVYGPKGGGKSVFLSTLPRPNNGLTVFISFDKVTLDALLDFYGLEEPPELEEKYRIRVYEPAVARYDDEGNMTYPGLDLNKPWTADMVANQVMAVMEGLEEEGVVVDNIILDRFDEAEGKVGKGMVYSAGKVEWGEKLNKDDSFRLWDLRASFIIRAMDKAEGIARHVAALTGKATEMKWVDYEEWSPKKQKMVTKKKREWVDAKWIERIDTDIFYIFELAKTDEIDEDGSESRRFWCTVRDSKKNDLFPIGKRVETTRTTETVGGAKVFWERRGEWDDLPEAEQDGEKKA